jgi:integrase
MYGDSSLGNEWKQPLYRRRLSEAPLPDIRFHDLRHSSATMLLSLGVHPKVVQEILGHSQISMTMDIYSLVLPTMQQEAMSKFNDALRG